MPGPGSYNVEVSKPEVNPGALGFKSTAARLAPSFPGSSAYMPSTIIFNPGPGRYDSQSSMKNAMKNGTRSEAIKYGLGRSKSVTRVLDGLPRQFNPPAIPDKMQTFGYIDSDEQGIREVKPVPPPSQMIMGVGGDTVGPGAYDQFIGTGISGGVIPSSFSSSKTKRRVFQQTNNAENFMPDSQNPGPGVYELKGFDWDKGSSAAFRSGTKMAHQLTKGEGLTESAENLHREIMSARGGGVGEVGGKSNFGRNGADELAQLSKANPVQSFGTTAVRDTCPRVHNNHVPHPSRANLYSDRKIGPGSYDNMKSSFRVSKQRTLRAEPVGFNGTAERPCMKREDSRGEPEGGRGGKAEAKRLFWQRAVSNTILYRSISVSLSAPGPGPIYNPDYLTLNFAVQKRVSGSRKIGVFGTTGPRFRPKNELEESSSRTEFNVGHGTYEHSPQEVRIVKPRYQSAFKRDGVKGGSFGSSNAPAGGFLLEGDNGYRQSDFNMRDDDTVEVHKKKVRPAFGTSAKRTDDSRNIDGEKFQVTPGPRYMVKVTDLAPPVKKLVNGGRKRDGEICTFGKDSRKFEGGQGAGETVGPGSYR